MEIERAERRTLPDSVPESAISAEDFKLAFRHHPAGVALVTADAGEGPVAMTISSLSSVGIDPPSLVYSVSPHSSSAPTLLRAETVVVHMLTSDAVALAKLGATGGADRFGNGIEWDRLPTGEPYYPQVKTWLRCRVVDRVRMSGSTLILAEAIGMNPHGRDDGTAEPSPLVYHNRKWYALEEQSRIP